MKRIKRVVAGTLTFCIMAAGATGVAAYDANGKFRAFGPANQPCSQYDALRDRRLAGHTAEQQEAIEDAVKYWVSGWATSWNYLSTDTYDITGGYQFEDLLEQVERFCERNPDKKLVNAVIIVGHAMHPWRLKQEPVAKSN